MTIAVAALAALGLSLFAAGLPLGRRPTLAQRVEPYLGGLHGRPGVLGADGPRVGTRWARRIAGLAPAPDDLARRLRASGDPRSPEQFRVEQVAWALASFSSAVALVAAGFVAGVTFAPASVPLFAGVAGVTGWAARDWWLGRQAARRSDALREELPPAIDLLVLALLAGESVPAALARVAGVQSGALAEEIRAVVADVRAGSTIVEALEALGRRVDEPSLARFVDALCTGIEKGAPLADVLRAQADDGRDLARRRLLELGGRREVWMLVPVVFLIMPVVVVWALFPGLVSLDLLVP